MQKINFSVDVTKIQKDRLRSNSFTTKDGQEVKQTLCDMVFIPRDEQVIKDGDTYVLKKVGFVVEKGTQEENTNILGDAMVFEDKEDTTPVAPPSEAEEMTQEELDSMPF